jgi:hypothetical protein
VVIRDQDANRRQGAPPARSLLRHPVATRR